MNFQAVRGLALAMLLMMWGITSYAAPYAALVMDARTGKVVHSENADTRLHPASLTKMMTLYLVFTEIRAGRMTAEQKIKISRYAASKPPSKLGLKAGQSIELKYLIRASAVKSANDAAAALAEAVSGSEPEFARRMTAAARAMGMRNTTFKNASGLTQRGHLSTARDMAVLGRRLFFDFPEYYNLFSRRSTDAKLKTVRNTNRRLLNAYPGADGIKTGYTNAAGFNLVSSARRGQERVIVSVFGGSSTAWRNERVAKLMDLGFRKMPSYAQTRKPARLALGAPGRAVASASTARRPMTLRTSSRPAPRPVAGAPVVAIAEAAPVVAEEAPVAAAVGPDVPKVPVQPDPAETVALAAAVDEAVTTVTAKAATDPIIPLEDVIADYSPADFKIVAPRLRPESLPVPKTIRMASASPKVPAADAPDMQKYIVQLGGKLNRSDAERLLLTTALQEMEALEGSSRRLAPTGQKGWFKAQFVGLSAREAQTACARLAARQTACEVVVQGS